MISFSLQSDVVSISNGATSQAITFPQAFSAITNVVAIVSKPDGGDDYFPTLRESTLSVTGCTFDLQGAISATGYKLRWIAIGTSATPTPPISALLCTVYGYTQNVLARSVSGIAATLTLVDGNGQMLNTPALAGSVIAGRCASAVTDGDGFFSIDVYRNDSITIPSDTKWNINIPGLEINKNVSLTSSTYDVGTLVT